MAERKYLYDNYVRSLHDKFLRRLEDIEAHYNFDLGDEFELAICELLRAFLPNKFGICRGFVVDLKGNIAGDDIIIYDQERFPTLKLVNRTDFARKEKIPIEAVYGYIEAKHSLDVRSDKTKCVFTKAVNQCINVKKLCSTRNKVILNQNDPYIIPSTDRLIRNEERPNYRNPVFGLILARYVSKEGRRLITPQEVHDVLYEAALFERNPFLPDQIIAGESNIISAGVAKGSDHVPTLFLVDDKEFGIEIIQKPNICFGLGLAQLFAAIDWIRLGAMPWADIVNDAKVDNYIPHGF